MKKTQKKTRMRRKTRRCRRCRHRGGGRLIMQGIFPASESDFFARKHFMEPLPAQFIDIIKAHTTTDKPLFSNTIIQNLHDNYMMVLIEANPTKYNLFNRTTYDPVEFYTNPDKYKKHYLAISQGNYDIFPKSSKIKLSHMFDLFDYISFVIRREGANYDQINGVCIPAPDSAPEFLLIYSQYKPPVKISIGSDTTTITMDEKTQIIVKNTDIRYDIFHYVDTNKNIFTDIFRFF